MLAGAADAMPAAAPAAEPAAAPDGEPGLPAETASASASASASAAPIVCAACGAAGARLKCGGCRRAHYCDAACQKRDWRAHKAACKQQS